jgi:hypothetical protein
MEGRTAGGQVAEYPVEDEGMEVDVEVEPAAEALDDGERASVAIRDAVLAGLAAIEVQERPDKDTEDGAAEAVVPGEQIAQPVGQAEDPLPHGDAGQHAVHEAGGALGHAPAAAARTEAAPLAGKGNQPLLGTGVATQAGEAVGQDAAGEELAELLLHELRQAGTVGTVSRFAEKGLQVSADNGMEDAALRLTWTVDRALDGHGPQVGSERGS